MEKVAQHKATIFINWYKDMLENHRERLFAYLGPTVCLDWFGRSCNGCKKVMKLLKSLDQFEHIIENIEPRKELRHRNIGNLKPKIVSKKDVCDLDENMHTIKYIDSEDDDETYCGKRKICDDFIENIIPQSIPQITDAQLNEPIQPSDDEFHTPEKSSVVIDVPFEKGGGDGSRIQMQYVVATGYLDMKPTVVSSPSCSTSTDTVNGNRQFLKLKIAYTEDPLCKEYTIWYMIYESKNECRRNLMTQFENAYNEDVKKINSNASTDDVC